MMTQETEKVRKQMQIVCIDDLVPQDHLLRIIDKAIDWSFIYDLVHDTYSDGMGRPSIDPVTLIKIPLIQYLYGIKSMRQTINLGRTIPVVLRIPIYLSRFFSIS